MNKPSCALTPILLLASGCLDTGQARVDVPLYLAGTNLTSPVLTAGNLAVQVDQAKLAFGPLYLCAGTSAGELCDTARLEWLDAAVVDLLAPAPVYVGDLSGTTGPLRSWMYDLGISSQLTRDQPFILPAAASLGGNSFVISGRVQLGATQLPFVANVPISQTQDTELGVPVIRKSTGEIFNHEIVSDAAGDQSPLYVAFDAGPLVRALDFSEFVQDQVCSADGAALVCAGTVEQNCATDGTLMATRDCTSLGQACLAGIGCAAQLEILPNSQSYRALRNALVAGARPTFTWGSP